MQHGGEGRGGGGVVWNGLPKGLENKYKQFSVVRGFQRVYLCRIQSELKIFYKLPIKNYTNLPWGFTKWHSFPPSPQTFQEMTLPPWDLIKYNRQIYPFSHCYFPYWIFYLMGVSMWEGIDLSVEFIKPLGWECHFLKLLWSVISWNLKGNWYNLPYFFFKSTTIFMGSKINHFHSAKDTILSSWSYYTNYYIDSSLI